MSHFIQNDVFSCRGRHLDPSEKTFNFRTPQKQSKGSTWTPKGAKACPKGSIFDVFSVPFWGPVPTVKTVFPCRREPHLRGSRVSQNSTFFMIFWSSAKRASRESLLEVFFRFWLIFEDFGCPLGILFGIIFLKKWDPKSVYFLGSILCRFCWHGGVQAGPQVRMFRNWTSKSLTRPAQALPGAAYPIGPRPPAAGPHYPL